MEEHRVARWRLSGHGDAPMIRVAALMARGLGTRMRRLHNDTNAPSHRTVTLDAAQYAAADSGLKSMIPVGGNSATGKAPRPFLDFILSGLADVGITTVVLVLAPPPEQDSIREYYRTTAPPTRLRVRFAEQDKPTGTATAVLAAAHVIGDEPFLVLNADNYYPETALRALTLMTTAGTIAFDRDTLVRDSNIDPERVGAFAALQISNNGQLTGIVEKPGACRDLADDAARWVGMNCWTVSPALVSVCQRVPLSIRGEYELPEAVALAIDEGMYVHAEAMCASVLDLSQRSDIQAVAERLATIEPRP